MSVPLTTAIVYIVLLTVIVVIDFRFRIIPNKLVYPGIIAAGVLSWFGIGWMSCLIGGVVLLGLALLAKRLFKAGFGWGDVKLFLLVGMMLGYPIIFLYMMGLGIASILCYVFLRLIKHKQAGDEVPYGAIMGVVAVATILFGGQIWQILLQLKS